MHPLRSEIEHLAAELVSCDTNTASTRERASGHGWTPPDGCEDTGRVVAPCKLGIKPRARVNSFSWARVKSTAEVKLNKLYCTVLYCCKWRVFSDAPSGG